MARVALVAYSILTCGFTAAGDGGPCVCRNLFSSGRQCAQPVWWVKHLLNCRWWGQPLILTHREPQGLLHCHPRLLSDTVESQKQTIKFIYVYCPNIDRWCLCGAHDRIYSVDMFHQIDTTLSDIPIWFHGARAWGQLTQADSIQKW